MKTNKLTGIALDWAVAKCEGFPVRDGFDDNCPEYSTNWAQGGPIIEREMISVWPWDDVTWKAEEAIVFETARGPTPLIAAMRCYVAAKLGDDIEIPEELNQGEDK
jgi:hypothetical protein